MVRRRVVVGGLVLAGTLLGLVAPLRAEEGRPAPDARLILNMLALGDPGRSLVKESLRTIPTTPGPKWEMLPDGSARFGNSTFHVIVKNPCPGHGPVALPNTR